LDYQGLLNAAQLEAVVTTAGPVLVVAGAGSGQTRPPGFCGAPPGEQRSEPPPILPLPLTPQATPPILRRAPALLDGRCEQVAGGTFHSFANLVLRRYGRALGLESSFTILDRGDAEDVIGLLRARLGFDKKDKRFPRKQTIAEMFSMAVNKS